MDMQDIDQIIRRHESPIKALRKMGLPAVPFPTWMQALKDFDITKKKDNDMSIDKSIAAELGLQAYCTDCGSQDLAYLDQYANGDYWKCKDCKKEFIWPNQQQVDKTTAGTIRIPSEETRYDTLKAKVVSFIHAYRDTQGKDIQDEIKALEEEVTQTREEWEAEIEERAERFFETYQLKEKSVEIREGLKFKHHRDGTVYTISKVTDNKVVIAWEDRVTHYDLSVAVGCFNNKVWIPV